MKIKSIGSPGLPPRELPGLLEEYLSGFKFTRSTTKRHRVLAWLIVANKRDLPVTRFDAEIIGDHVFNTTVSEIERYSGVTISRRPTKRPTRFGTETDCKEYWLEDDQIEQATKLLTKLTRPRDG